MNTRRGDWIQTFTGRQFWPLDPREEEIDILDVAHALSMQCRYAGHCTRFYSVAEHSVIVSRAVPTEFALWGLLHDASEAYLVDLPRPVKRHVAGYVEAEAAVMRCVCQRFGLAAKMPWQVASVDERILCDERAQIMSPCFAKWDLPARPLGVLLDCLRPPEAERAFLDRFEQLAYAKTTSDCDRR